MSTLILWCFLHSVAESGSNNKWFLSPLGPHVAHLILRRSRSWLRPDDRHRARSTTTTTTKIETCIIRRADCRSQGDRRSWRQRTGQMLFPLCPRQWPVVPEMRWDHGEVNAPVDCRGHIDVEHLRRMPFAEHHEGRLPQEWFHCLLNELEPCRFEFGRHVTCWGFHEVEEDSICLPSEIDEEGDVDVWQVCDPSNPAPAA